MYGAGKLTPHANATASRTSRQIARNMVICLLEPDTRVIHANHTEHLWSELVDIGLVRDSDAGAFEVFWIRVTPMIGCVHCADTVCGIVGAGFASVNRCVFFLVNSSESAKPRVSMQ